MGFATFSALFGGGNSASAMAGMARRNEARKQSLIDQGTQMINAIYGGGSVPTFSTAGGVYNPSSQYYVYNPKSGYKLAGNANANMLKHGKLFTRGTDKTFTGFTPQFFQDRAGAYERYAMPQLGEQYENAKRSIDYGLADRGLYDSSAGMTARSNLTRENAQQVQNVADEGKNQSQQLQTSVENARQSALQQLYATSDPQGAAASALSTASSFQVPSAFAPVGDAFANLASQYAINNALSQYNQPVVYNSQYGLGAPVNAGALPQQ